MIKNSLRGSTRIGRVVASWAEQLASAPLLGRRRTGSSADAAPGRGQMIEYFLERLEDRVLLSSAAASVPKTVADLYSTREGAVLRVNAEAGVLANDTSSGASLRVTDFDLTSKFGARVQMANDGRFTYDPRSAKALTSLPLGKAAEDTFKYTVNGRIVGHVTVTVLGAADAPEDTARP